ncbi:hypothetical protein G6F32_016998 [Rhizopus arrhizus]|nr:hypothetical protein G6F32_016998 [Rhizopus arrhizus]
MPQKAAAPASSGSAMNNSRAWDAAHAAHASVMKASPASCRPARTHACPPRSPSARRGRLPGHPRLRA